MPPMLDVVPVVTEVGAGVYNPFAPGKTAGVPPSVPEIPPVTLPPERYGVPPSVPGIPPVAGPPMVVFGDGNEIEGLGNGLTGDEVMPGVVVCANAGDPSRRAAAVNASAFPEWTIA